MFSVRRDGTESHSLGQQSLDILAVSAKGQLAVVLDRRFSVGFSSSGTLAVMWSTSTEPQSSFPTGTPRDPNGNFPEPLRVELCPTDA
jgi:hypothetical protein